MTAETPLIICEKNGAWAAALRWQSHRPLLIVETRSLLDARAELQKFPGSVVAMEVSAVNAESVFRLLIELQRLAPACCQVVFLPPTLRVLADLFQETGAWVVASPRRLDRLARYVERHLAAIEPPIVPLREAIWSRLPWKSRGA